MATKEELEAKAQKLVETWASIVDAGLQDFMAKGKVNDRQGAALAALRLYQAAKMLSGYFQEVGCDMLNTEAEVATAKEAVEQMYETVRKRIDVALGSPTFAPAAEVGGSIPDRSTN